MLVSLRRLFSYRLLVTATILFFIISLTFYPIQSDDLFMYLAIARNYFSTGNFPSVDPFLYTTTQSAWTIWHQWLGYFAFYGLYTAGGFNLIILAKTLLLSVMVMIPALFIRRPIEVLVWSLSVILALYGISFRFMERTALFSDFFILLVLLITLLEYRRPSRWKYFLPLIFLFWVNLHPAFPVGWILCALFLIFRISKFKTKSYQHFLILTVMSVFVCWINPQGLQGLLYPFKFAGQEAQVYRQYYFEWLPTLHTMYRYQWHTFFLVLMVLVNLSLLVKVRKAKPLFETILSLFFIAYGFYAIRFVPTFGFGLVLLNTFLSFKIKDFNWVKPLTYIIALTAFCLGVKNIFFGYETISGPRHFGLGLDEKVIPEKAARFIMQYPQIGNVFNSHMFGSYLVWAWHDTRKVFYHGFVTDMNLFLNEYAAFSKNKAVFESQVEKYQIRAFLLDRFKGNESLIQILTENARWALAYQDESSLIFLPRTGLKD